MEDYHIPVPERGYWARLRAGKKIHRPPLPLLGPGMSDEVTIGAGHDWHYRPEPTDREIWKKTPLPPAFERDLDERERLKRLDRERVERPLKDADALRRSHDIRDYVGQVKTPGGGDSYSIGQTGRWRMLIASIQVCRGDNSRACETVASRFWRNGQSTPPRATSIGRSLI